MFSTAVISDCGDCARSDVDPRNPVTRQETTKQITRINVYGVGVGVGEGIGVIDGVAVGVGVEVATTKGIGVAVGVGEFVVPSFEGAASNTIVPCDDVVEVDIVAGVGVGVAVAIGAGVGAGVGSGSLL